jgi:hypothetical protein
MASKLTEYHDAEDVHVFRWNKHLALVQLSRWCVTLVPTDGAKRRNTPDDCRSGLKSLLESDPSREAAIAFAQLSMWANRRALVSSVGDTQIILNAIYDRQCIRESLQWLYQHRVSGAAGVRLATVATMGGSTRGEETPGHALIMRCGEWTGIVMNCIADAGSDPLFPESP